MVHYRGPRIDRDGLLKYIVSFREHTGFHEQCVEQMFLDIKARCRCEKLTVYARYTRRGGLEYQSLPLRLRGWPAQHPQLPAVVCRLT